MKRAILPLGVLLAAAIVGWWLIDSGPDAPVPVEIEVGGYRLLEPPHHTPVFDGQRLPRLRFAGGDLRDVIWRGEDDIEARFRLVDAGRMQVAVVESWASTPPAGPGHVCLRTDLGRVCLPAHWRTAPSALTSLANIAEHRAAGRFDEAGAALAAADRGDPQVDLWIGVEAARLARARGDIEGAIDAWQSAADDARRLGITTEAARRLRAGAYTAWTRRQAARMGALLDEASRFDDARRDPQGHANQRYVRALHAHLLDDWQQARRHYEAAIEGVAAFADAPRERVMTEAFALLLADLGDDAGALRLLEPLAEGMAKADPDTRARYLINVSWLMLRSLPADADSARRDTLDTALTEARLAARTSKDRMRTANAATNQAWAALDRGDAETARLRLSEARALDPDGGGFAAPYAHLLGARLALQVGELDDAEARFAQIEAREKTDAGPISELGWRARFGRGRVARARGADDAALAHFRAALDVVERLGQRASLRGDRATFHADRRALADETIDLLMARGDISAAFAVADDARVRPLRALQAGARITALDPQARRRWSAALDAARATAETARRAAAEADLAPVADEAEWTTRLADARRDRDRALDAAFALLDDEAPLTVPPGFDGDAVMAALAPDELLFAFGPHGDGWRGFRVDRQGIESRMVDADGLPDVWRAVPAHVRHVYVVPGGHPAAFGLATAGDAPLLARVSVSFLPYAGLLAHPRTPPTGTPLVVADPRGDLSHAAEEGRAVAAALSGSRLLMGGEASPPAVLAGLADASVFHFAGHGVLNPERPWEAHLRLSDPHRLELSDVLSHPVGSRLVVLSGCETGVDAVLLDDRVVGLPEAFLAAGAGSVLATDRPVPDRATRAFMARFYAADGVRRPAHALRTAALDARAAGEPSWSAFRLIGAR